MPIFSQIIPRLPVKDLERTIAFYGKHFGFTTEVIWPDQRPTFAILCRDKTCLGFFETNDQESHSIGYAELYIQVTDLSTLHDSLKKQLSIEWGPEIYSYGRQEFALRDPDSYLIIFTEPSREQPTSNEPSTGSAG